MAKKKKKEEAGEKKEESIEDEWEMPKGLPHSGPGLAMTQGEEAMIVAKETRGNLRGKADRDDVERLEKKVRELSAALTEAKKKLEELAERVKHLERISEE